MGWFSRRPKPSRERRREQVAAVDAAEAHLRDWAAARDGVEAWIEPETMASPPSMLLVAWDGESTRRRIASVEAGHRLAATWKIRSHDAGIVSYPQRLRDYNARNRGQ